jgi:hypothetical protein
MKRADIGCEESVHLDVIRFEGDAAVFSAGTVLMIQSDVHHDSGRHPASSASSSLVGVSKLDRDAVKSRLKYTRNTRNMDIM